MTEQTPQSFYWIGFLIADGSFHSGGKFELGLAEKDLGVIEAFCEYIAYNNNIMYREDTKSYRISFANSIENPKFMETLDIPEHISNREGSTTITIRICRREILQLLQDVITNNNLFHLKRKWNKLMIKEPSASES